MSPSPLKHVRQSDSCVDKYKGSIKSSILCVSTVTKANNGTKKANRPKFQLKAFYIGYIKTEAFDRLSYYLRHQSKLAFESIQLRKYGIQRMRLEE